MAFAFVCLGMLIQPNEVDTPPHFEIEQRNVEANNSEPYRNHTYI